MMRVLRSSVVCLVVAFAGCAAQGGEPTGDAAEAVSQNLTQSEATTTKDLKEKYVLLGATSIRGVDRDTLGIGRDDGLYSSVRLRVTGGALKMDKVRIVFGNGQDFEPQVRMEFDDRQPTRDLDFPGQGRFIKSITFLAEEQRGEPIIEVWGDKAAPKPEWVRIGASHVDGAKDHDTLTVGADNGSFSAVQLRVKDSDIVLADMKITFGDDKTFEPNLRLVFNENTRSRIIDLPGDKRVIKTVDYTYGNLPGGGAADVVLFGLR
jgi:hypothetical protein